MSALAPLSMSDDRTYVLEAFAFLEGARHQRALQTAPALNVRNMTRRLHATQTRWAPLLDDAERDWAHGVLERTKQWLTADGHAQLSDLLAPPSPVAYDHAIPDTVAPSCPACGDTVDQQQLRYRCARCQTEWVASSSPTETHLLAGLDVTPWLYGALSHASPEWTTDLQANTPRPDGPGALVLDTGGGTAIAEHLQVHGWDALGVYRNRDELLAAVAVGVRGYEGSWVHTPRAGAGRAMVMVGGDMTRDAGRQLGAGLTARLAPDGVACFLAPFSDTYPSIAGDESWGPRADPGRTVLWSHAGLRAHLRQFPGLHLESMSPAAGAIDRVSWEWPTARAQNDVRSWKTRMAPIIMSVVAQITGQTGWRVVVVRRIAADADGGSAWR